MTKEQGEGISSIQVGYADIRILPWWRVDGAVGGRKRISPLLGEDRRSKG